VITKKFSITFLGTSAAEFLPNSSTSAYLVEISQKRILIDAGIGTLRQLGKIKISPKDIDIILITHWHFDHYAGLPSVLRARRKSAPIKVYGPSVPILARLYMACTFFSLGPIFTTIKDNFLQVYDDFYLQAILNSHGVDSYGWTISEKSGDGTHKGRTLVISGDTRPTASILNAARGVALLVHEATYPDKETQKALLHHHTTSTEAAHLALKAGAGALAITHIPRRYSHLEFQREAEKLFPGVLIPGLLDTIYLEATLEESRVNSRPVNIRMEHGHVSK
jgi:ribonuclease Z